MMVSEGRKRGTGHLRSHPHGVWPWHFLSLARSVSSSLGLRVAQVWNKQSHGKEDHVARVSSSRGFNLRHIFFQRPVTTLVLLKVCYSL